MHYAENDKGLLSTWNLKELADWRVPMSIKGKKQVEQPEVEFTQVLDETHNYIVLYFDNDVDWLQAQTLFGIKPVKLLSTKKGANNINGQKIGLGRVLRGSEVINRLLKENGSKSKTNRNK